jgi:hypothetical protein
LEQEESKVNNTMESYFDGYELTHFKVKKGTYSKRALLTENEIYLQQLSETISRIVGVMR